ncbi:MAG: cytosine permease [Candidatus Sericytochromatia bacterium]|nr:cytosine permease [Candidatus Sericytochromatia bacterium]
MARIAENDAGLQSLSDTDDLNPELCNADLRPTGFAERYWNTWHIASLWIGMAVCIPTYMLASYMITDGLSLSEALWIIFLGNLIVAIPMVFNGHAGTRYGIPFPVLGRASFGVRGVHVPSVLRALVACGWFGVQTWIGGLALASIAQQILPLQSSFGLNFGCFMLFWCINIFFIWRGTESVRFLETIAAPLLIVVGLAMLAWGIQQGGGLQQVLAQSDKLRAPSVAVSTLPDGQQQLRFNLLSDRQGAIKATEFQIGEAAWQPLPSDRSLTRISHKGAFT